MNIFVHSASECLTNVLPHGDGLIAFSLCSELLERGHCIWATTQVANINMESSMRIVARSPRCRIHSLRGLEYNRFCDRQFDAWRRDGVNFDLAWRLHPYGHACPYPPRVGSLPLVVGPMFYEWPQCAPPKSRYWFTIRPLVEPLFRWGWRQTLKRAKLLIASTPAHARTLLSTTSSGQRVEYIPVIVSPPIQLKRAAQHRRRNERSPITLVYVAGLRANKRPSIACDIMTGLRERRIDARLVICGDGPLRSEIERTALTGGWRNELIMHGNIPNKEVYEKLAAADVLISPAIGESYGRNIVEALSVGTPVVAHRSGGPQELIRDRETGYLVDGNAADGFVHAILELADASRWVRCSRAGLADAATWSPEVVGTKLETILGEVAREN